MEQRGAAQSERCPHEVPVSELPSLKGGAMLYAMAPPFRILAVIAVGALAACASAPAANTLPPQVAATTVETVTPDVRSAFPSAADTGVPADVTLRPWTGGFVLSEEEGVDEQVDGRDCVVFDGFDIDLADSGDYLYVDVPCALFRNSRFRTNSVVSNTSAIVQQANANELLIIDHCDFDGGPFHQRGIQANWAALLVLDSRFVRFGNAAAEFNDEAATHDFTMIGNYAEETAGWDPSDHVDGIQVGAAGSVTIRDNTVLVTPYGDDTRSTDYVSNSAVAIWAELGDVTGSVVVEGNLLAGGGHVMYLEQKPPYVFRGSVVVTGNVIDRRYSPLGGIWGVLADTSLPSDLSWVDNQFDDGSPISLQSAIASG